MKDRIYSGDLCNWAAVQSRFGIRIPAPAFVHTVTATRWDQHLVVAIYSHDGRTFSAVAGLTRGRTGREEISRPLRSRLVVDPERRLVAALPQLRLPQIRDWFAHVRPPKVPEIVSISGPGPQVLRLLRDALGLTGANLRRAVDRAGLLRVAPSDYHALVHIAARLPGVTVLSDNSGART